MDESQDIRRSNRRRVRPVEFWNFVKPEESLNEPIIYNENELSKCSIFKPFSCSYNGSSNQYLLSFEENMTGIAKRAGKTDKRSTLTAQNATSSPKSLGKRRRLEKVEPKGKAKSQSLLSSKDPAHPAKPSRKLVHRELTEDAEGHQSLSDHEEMHYSRLTDNQILVDQEPSHRNEGSAMTNGMDIVNSSKKDVKKRKLKGNSGHVSDDSSAPQKKRGRKQRNGNEEPQIKKGRNSADLQGDDEGKETPPVIEGESSEQRTKQDNARVDLLPGNSSKQPTNNLSTLRENLTESIPLAEDATITTTQLNPTGRDITQNTTTLEQPSFQNVFSSTVIDAPGKDVFKVPRLPSFRRPPFLSLKVSSMSLDPSMVPIPEEEEEESEEQRHKKEGQNKQEKEALQANRRKQQQKQQSETEGQELQMNQQEQENGVQEQEEEQVQQKQQKQKGRQRNRGNSDGDGGVGVGNDNASATVTTSGTKTGASLRETSQERTSAALPSQPKDQENTGTQIQENTRTEAFQIMRRSSRVRMKPLEFWNFEKVEVNRQQDGEVHITHQKQDPLHLSIKTRVMDCSMAHRSQLGHGFNLTTELLKDTLQFRVPEQNRAKGTTVASQSKGMQKISPSKSIRKKKNDSNNNYHPALSPSQGKKCMDAEEIISSWSLDHSPAKSPSKKKLFSPRDNFLHKPVEDGGTFKKRIKGGMMVMQINKFQDMQFVVIEKDSYRCYLAQGMQIKDKSIYTGYVFLERGQIVWNSTRRTTMYVIEGYGSLKCANGESGSAYSLKPRDTLDFEKRLKLSVKKDGRCKLLKVHIVLGPHL